MPKVKPKLTLSVKGSILKEGTRVLVKDSYPKSKPVRGVVIEHTPPNVWFWYRVGSSGYNCDYEFEDFVSLDDDATS